MFFRNIAADYMRIYELTAGKPRIIRVLYPFTCPGFLTLIWFRLIQANRRWRIPLLYYIFAIILRVIHTFFQWLFGICISSNCDIGPGLYIAHHGQIFVGVKSMGANCTIGHNVTIGRTEKEHGYPTFGNNIYVGPGAVIIGRIEIGDNVKIGPNTVVRRSVPSDSIVMALPPKVIRMTTKKEWLHDKGSTETKQAKDDTSGRYQGEVKESGEGAAGYHKKTASTPMGGSNQNRKTQGGQDKKAFSARNRRRRGNWGQNNKPGGGAKVRHENKSGHQSRRDVKSTVVGRNPKPPDSAGDHTNTAGRKTIDGGTSWRKNPNRDKWVEDMDGESLDG